jgi:hypothetical protein
VIRVVNSARLTDLDVVKANGSKLMDLDNGAVVDVSKSAYKWVNVKANTVGSKIRSVVFMLNGVEFRTDNLAPYQLSGIGSLLDFPLQPVPGTYTLTATPYSEVYGLGIAGQSLTVSFTVVNGVSAASAARTKSSGEESIVSEEATDPIRIYPVPVHDELHVELYEKEETHVGIYIHNAQGTQLFTDEGLTGKFKAYSVNTLTLGLKPGIYFIQFQYANGKREVRKFIKE